MKRLAALLAFFLLLTVPARAVETLYDDAITIEAPSATLMEKSTGEILYEKNAYEHLAPASVTKVMTLLLIVEELESGRLALDDMISASARAASMGGSQIWLEEGEQMSVSEMIKCIAVVSANDCCVALAEHIAGSEEAFVARMNARAAELGMADTSFVSCSGLLETDSHYTCAHDIAVMSRELIGHDIIKDYTTIWMDTVRGGEFTLANTNKLIYHYNGATGLKTGFTSKAMYCLSATAERDGVEYIAVVLHAPTTAQRFESAKTLLNHAFANYTLSSPEGKIAVPPVKVLLGSIGSVQAVYSGSAQSLVKKTDSGSLSYVLDLPECVDAPIAQGQQLGCVEVYVAGELTGRLPLVSAQSVECVSVPDLFLRLFCALVGN